ncbi:MAG: type I restriction enzyme HsdR N-terminal domain-containing protein [Defluviitaleaceae bacterium]|nr:type I restriction enzyme HsdR N-terminal domain-containing protein [Defluviitaleaceae bacterium]
MQFNQFIWDNFKDTQRGKSLIEYFTNFNEKTKTKSEAETLSFILESTDYKTPNLALDENELSEIFSNLSASCDELLMELRKDGIDVEVNSFEDFEVFFENVIRWTDPSDEKDPERILHPGQIPFESERLYFLYPDYCFPYFFDGTYYRIEAIFKEFGIFVPPVPKKTDMYGRSRHYLELCKSVHDFRVRFGMDKYEFPAFLYGFAVEVVKKYNINDAFPDPRKAYFVGGGKYNGEDGDFSFLDSVSDSSVARWQGNPETQPGDIIVMYCLSPRSYVHSIWRAVSPGFLDPFFHFYKSIYAGKPVVVAPILLDEMKNDEVLSGMPLIKANMQGINGRVVEKVYYDRIMELLKQKGVAVENLPQLTNELVVDVVLKNEKDVEKHLLEPLLKRLGYNETDWKKQFKLRMGRGDRVYPDYVIFPNEERNNESGYWIWEAKFSIASNKQLEEDFGQAKSYALRLNCKGLGLISKEGVWISESKSGFSFDKLSYWSWKQIGEIDCFNDIFSIAGNRKTFAN